MEYGPEFDDLRGDYSSLEERLEGVADKADDGDDGNGRLAEYFERELALLEAEIELRKNDRSHIPTAVPSAYQLHEGEGWQRAEEGSREGRPEP